MTHEDRINELAQAKVLAKLPFDKEQSLAERGNKTCMSNFFKRMLHVDTTKSPKVPAAKIFRPPSRNMTKTNLKIMGRPQTIHESAKRPFTQG